jgi:hypothetical protein
VFSRDDWLTVLAHHAPFNYFLTGASFPPNHPEIILVTLSGMKKKFGIFVS